MNFGERGYVDIVRDLLTHLTGGVANEAHLIGEEGVDRIMFEDGPVERVSHLVAKVAGKDGEPVDYRYSEREFTLVADDEDPEAYIGVRLRPRVPRPVAGTTVVVNYYPRRTRATPITDVNVGGVARTLLETVARELATQYVQLQRVYESGFVETAEGRSLDRVAALVDTRRIAKGQPIGKVRFSRRQGAAGTIFIPAGTAVTNGSGVRYLTTEDGRMQPTQSTLEVWVHGESAGTDTLGAGELQVVERAIAGVDRVGNDQETWRASEDERDEQLAARARRAIHAAGKGTLDALRYGLEGLDFVSGVSLGEYTDQGESPVEMPGMLRVDVALSEDTEANKKRVARKIESLRPAGIWIKLGFAEPLTLDLELSLTLAGSELAHGSIEELERGVEERLLTVVRDLGPGAVLRQTRLVGAALEDTRIADVALSITAGGQAVSEASWTVPADASPQAKVQFASHSYESEAATEGAVVLTVNANVALRLEAGSPDVATLEADLEASLDNLLANLGAGEALSFERVLAALRDPEEEDSGAARWAIAAEATILQIDDETGASTSLVPGASFLVPAGSTFEIEDFKLEVLIS